MSATGEPLLPTMGNMEDPSASSQASFYRHLGYADGCMPPPLKSSKLASFTLSTKESGESFGIARTPWYGTAIILVSEIMGTGVLGLPYVATTLGWATTMIAVPLFAFFAFYAGYQLKVVKMSNVNFHSFADAGAELVAPWFGKFTKACMLVNWGALAVYFMIATADGIGNISTKGFLGCGVNRTIVAALLLVLPAQSRDFHTISKFLSLPSTLAIIATIIIVIVQFTDGVEEDEFFSDTTIVGVAEGTTVFDFLQSLSSLVFAYQGQSIFMELMSEMKEPAQITKSLGWAYLFMMSWYAVTIIIAYGIKGEDVDGFLPDSLEVGALKSTVGVLIVFHIIVAYVIAIQPFHFWLHSIIFPKTFNKAGRTGQIHWFILTVGFIVFAFVIGNLIPFFADLQALIGAMFGAPIVFGWPSLYYLLATKRNTENGTWGETFSSIGLVNTFITLLFLCVIMPLFFVLGTWGSVVIIIDDIKNAGTPFSC